MVAEPPVPRHLKAGSSECRRRIGNANRRNGFFHAGELPSVQLRRTALRSSLPSHPLQWDISIEGWTDRFVIVDVEGETVVIDVAAPAGQFDEFAPKAEKLLEVVEWIGG